MWFPMYFIIVIIIIMSRLIDKNNIIILYNVTLQLAAKTTTLRVQQQCTQCTEPQMH